MKISLFIITLFVVFLGFVTFSGLFTNLASMDNYNISISETFQGAYTNQTELADLIDDTTEIGLNLTDSAKEAKQLEGDYIDSSKALIRTSKIAWDALPITTRLILGISEILHIPPVAAAVAIGIIIVLLVFAFLALIFRWAT